MTRPRSALALAALTILLGACGSTRYVVVQPTSANVAATPTTEAAGPTSAEDEVAVRAAIDGALGLDGRPLAERSEFIEGGDDLGPTVEAVNKLVKDLKVSLRIDEVVVHGDAATATVTVVVNGEDYAAGLPVELVRAGDGWKVTRGGACAVLAVGSPCPDA